MKRLILTSCLALCIALTARAGDIQPIDGLTPETLVGGADNLKIVTTAKQVTVFRVWQDTGQPDDQKFIPMDGLKCNASSNLSGPEQKSTVTALTTTANFTTPSKCVFNPGIVIRFQADAKTLDFVICLGCDDIQVWRDGKPAPPALPSGSTTYGFGKDARSAFIALAKKAFPDDPAIKALQLSMTTADLITYLQNAGEAYYDQFHAIPETPENYKVVAALLGANADKKTFIELNNSQLSPNGEVLDEWGTPLRFNFTQDTSTPIAAISAGKDKIFGTSDDIPKPSAP